MSTTKLPFALSPLDPKFVVAKPQTSITDERMLELEAGGRLVKTRKRDGYCGLATVTGPKRKVCLYTRGIADTSARFPQIIEALRESAIPTNSLVPGEMFFRTPDGDVDRLDIFSRFSKSNPERALMLQGDIGQAEFMVFAPIILAGRDVTTLPFGNRHDITREWFDRRVVQAYLTHMTPLHSSVDALRARVVDDGWEGLVLYDTLAPTEYRLDGKTADPPRPEGCWKWKPIFEDDFIVRKFAWGTGKNADRAGKLFLSQIDPTTGIEVACGEVADLGNRDMKLQLAQMTYPFVVQVEFESRTVGGACRVSHLMRVRDDKELAGCVLPKELHGLSKTNKK